MSETSTQWMMMKAALRGAIEGLPGYRVRYAVFTTYAFEPEFFESSILPLLLPEGEADLSLTSAVRRLQVEALLRDVPIEIDVYFDQRVVMAGCPLLPYEMKPMRSQGEFHGKVILLLLENQAGSTRCILGAGSANLTQAGWWENIEAFHLTDAFDPAKPPAGLLPGLLTLLDHLSENSPASKATTRLRDSLVRAVPARAKAGEAVFGVFLPGEDSFLGWLKACVQKRGSRAVLEVISPYFAESDQASLVADLLDVTGCKRIDLWLPVDPWQAGGPAALIENSTYCALSKVADLRWCRMRDKLLTASRQRDATPRFLHAKLIRLPGKFVFMGSVNFSNKAFHVNFEAGFVFPDRGGAWLEPVEEVPTRFLKPTAPARHEGVDDDCPDLLASFNWQSGELNLQFVRESDREQFADVPIQVLDAQGREWRGTWVLPTSIIVGTDDTLHRDLQANPWICVAFPDGRMTLVWVRQTELDFRPPREDLCPDAWRIIDMWRSLTGGRNGSQPGDFDPLEIILNRRFKDGESPPVTSEEHDMFVTMASVHGSFYLLRQCLREERARGVFPRIEYYLGAPRPDTLANLVERIANPEGGKPLDAVAAWVMLQWILQICRDHEQLRVARALRHRAERCLERLIDTPPLKAIGQSKFIEWAQQMFLCEPGGERDVMPQPVKMEVQ
ncbi:phospholipase D-like domain-containing protein [Burkholderia sp. LMG 13014]|uniref:phospholipase D-like domain-containing protein n=1 Tax=Burkholderia sp. LMG 13014 TaxID=2709306 RepID=UPI001965096D|nr:phospholipase D-like domain-containing protein [Burkholderia sp. LMG 13014]